MEKDAPRVRNWFLRRDSQSVLVSRLVPGALTLKELHRPLLHVKTVRQ